MRRLLFATQTLDPADPILAATIAKVRALAARLDEVVVLCDTAVAGCVPANVRVHEFYATSQAARGVRFTTALARELRPRPLGFVAHMVPLYAVIAAPLVRGLRIPLLLWYTHWKGHSVVCLAERVSTGVVSVDRRSFPLDSAKVHAIGHGIDLAEFPCAPPAPADGPLRALVLGRYSPAKGLETILRGAALAGDVEIAAYGSVGDEYAEHKRSLERLAVELGLEARLYGAVPRTEVPALLAWSHVLVNNMRSGAPDKVVYEAAASCVPVLASNAVFDELLPAELRFVQDDPESLAGRLSGLGRARRPELREAVAERHSVEHWADALLAVLQSQSSPSTAR